MQIEPLDLTTVDEWAVSLVCREGVKMNLNTTERVVAAVRMRDEYGLLAPEIAARLRCELKDVEAMWRRWRRVGHKAIKALENAL